ncbi:MAG: hypothetical protein BWY59_00747 [Verrucomicrobia bacterium ADurb.Bin345]|nr:MAG: hypothetical protein BWY59_00747 [Verrucomicrobia bacterium ADurb.Bin345]
MAGLGPDALQCSHRQAGLRGCFREERLPVSWRKSGRGRRVRPGHDERHRRGNGCHSFRLRLLSVRPPCRPWRRPGRIPCDRAGPACPSARSPGGAAARGRAGAQGSDACRAGPALRTCGRQYLHLRSRRTGRLHAQTRAPRLLRQGGGPSAAQLPERHGPDKRPVVDRRNGSSAGERAIVRQVAGPRDAPVHTRRPGKNRR